MNKDWTIKKLFEEICRVEVEHKLFEKKIDGVYFWKIIRFALFKELTKKLNLYEEAHPHPQVKHSGNRYMKIIKSFINGTVNGPMIGLGDVEIVLFPHTRKVAIDSKLIDIYSYHLEDKWKQEGIKHLIIERSYRGEFLRKASATVRYYQPLTFLSSRFKPKKETYVNFSMDDLKSIANIPIETIETLSTENISRFVNDFKHEYDYYNKIFSKHMPKKIYLLVSYLKHRHSLISAANDLDIETIEIQHGTIGSYHVGYSYPSNINIPYFPKKMILWGKFWFDISQLPIHEKNISYAGFPYLNQEVEKYSETPRDEFRVLFISQGTIGKLLVDIALKFASQNKKFNIVYRLHPSEAEKWKVLYPKLYAASMEKSNVIVETATENPLYKSFTESKFVVGVYSTALIESLAVSCKLILVDLPGVEYFQDLIDKRLVKKVENADQLLSVIKEQDKVVINSDYFFENHKNMKA